MFCLLQPLQHLPLDVGGAPDHDDRVDHAGEDVIVDGAEERLRPGVHIDLEKQ